MKRIADEWSVPFLPKRRLRREVKRANDARDCGEWKVAAEHYRRALRFAPNDAKLWMQVGHACKEGGDLDGAKAAYMRAEKLEPGNIDTQTQLGHLYKLLGQNDHAVLHYQAAVHGGSADEHALHFLVTSGLARADGGEPPVTRLDEADAARDAGIFEKAARLYHEAAQADPRGPIFVQQGNCLKETGALLAAEKAYMSALKLDPGDADCLLQLGHLMKVMGDLGRAEIYYDTSARLDPDRPDARTELAALRAGASWLETSRPAAKELPRAPGTQVVAGMVESILQNIKFAHMQRRS